MTQGNMYVGFGSFLPALQEAGLGSVAASLVSSATHQLRVKLIYLLDRAHPSVRVIGGLPRRLYQVQTQRQKLFGNSPPDFRRSLVAALRTPSSAVPLYPALSPDVDVDVLVPDLATLDQVLDTLYVHFHGRSDSVQRVSTLVRPEYSGSLCVTRATLVSNNHFMGLFVRVNVDLVCPGPGGLGLDFDVNSLRFKPGTGLEVDSAFLSLFAAAPQIVLDGKPLDPASLPNRRLQGMLKSLTVTAHVLKSIRDGVATLMFESVHSKLDRPGLRNSVDQCAVRDLPHVRLTLTLDLEISQQFAQYYREYVWYLFFKRVPKMTKDFRLLNVDARLTQCILEHLNLYASTGWVEVEYSAAARTLDFAFYETVKVSDLEPYATSRFTFN